MGCGTGWLPIALDQLGVNAQCVCIDINACGLQLCTKNVASYGLESKVTVLKSDLFERLPSDSKYDFTHLIVTHFSLSYSQLAD